MANYGQLVAKFFKASRQDLTLDRVVRRHIRSIMSLTDGNLSAAALLLGMHRRTLQRWLRANPSWPPEELHES